MITFRPIVPQDGEAFQRFVRGLSLESRLHRFLLPVKELAPATLRALTQPDQARHVGLIALDGTAIIGEGRYAALGDSGRGEFAIAVADEWQRQGVGARILGTLIAAARRAGLAVLEGEVLRSNAAMLKFMRRAGFRLRDCPGDGRLAIAERNLF
ncbi:MAG TPA: GNAT family N-acetyltransferase [Burkholderiales bacterium]|jgi:acetyltransferase